MECLGCSIHMPLSDRTPSRTSAPQPPDKLNCRVPVSVSRARNLRSDCCVVVGPGMVSETRPDGHGLCRMLHPDFGEPPRSEVWRTTFPRTLVNTNISSSSKSASGSPNRTERRIRSSLLGRRRPRRRGRRSPRWGPRGLWRAVTSGLLLAALNVVRAMPVDRPRRGTAGAPYVDHRHQVERERSSPAMSSPTMRRAL
jgi:hypothetical protein